MHLFVWYLFLLSVLFIVLAYTICTFDHGNSKRRMPGDKHKETHLSGVRIYLKFQAGAAFRIALMMTKF